jgi:hypothetical protein
LGENVINKLENTYFKGIQNVVLSPATSSIVLLHGLVILFATTYYMGMEWERTFTIGFYLLVSVWGGVTVFIRFRERPPILNRIDMAMIIFLMTVLTSITTHWWEGTVKQILQLPFLIFVPYMLGRAMNIWDGIKLRSLFMLGGLWMTVLIFPEYLRYVNYGFPYIDSPYPHLFGKNIGSMMAGQLLAFGLISLFSIYMSSSKVFVDKSFRVTKAGFLTFAAMSAMIFELVWTGSRGPLLIVVIGIVAYIIFSSITNRKHKIKILLSIALIIIGSIYLIAQRKGAQDHYLHLLQKPAVLSDVRPEKRNSSSKQVIGGASIIGQAACDRIVDSISERWVHYEQALVISLKNQLLGVGANNYGFFACQGPGAFPHNVILQVFAELGGIIGVLYCYILWTTIRVPFKIHQSLQGKPGQTIVTWVLTFLIMQLIFALISGDYFASAHLYFGIGLAASMDDLNTNCESQKNNPHMC